MASGIRLTMDILRNRLSNINPNIEIVSDTYKNTQTPLNVRCKVCNYEWMAKPCHLLRGHGCIKCYKKRIMLSNCDFLKLINKDIAVMNEYNGYHSSIHCKCKICDYEWETMAQTLIHKHGCPKCGINKLSKENFKQKLYLSGTNLRLIGDYFGMANNITVQCLKCGYKYQTNASNTLRHGCRKCYDKNRTMSLENFIYRLEKYNKNISYVSGFKNGHSKVKVKCSNCGYIWETISQNLLGYTGCPNCKKSHGEDAIKKYLDNNKIEYEWQKRFDDLYGNCNRKLSYDFYLPSCNVLIEYQGKQHYFPIDLFGGEPALKIRKEYDNKKREYARSKNIDLLEINYDDDIEEKLNIYFKTKSRND